MLEIKYKEAMETAFGKHAKNALAPEQINLEPKVDLKKGMNATQDLELKDVLKEGMNAAFRKLGGDALVPMKKALGEKSLNLKTQKVGLSKAVHSFVQEILKERQNPKGPAKQPPHFK